MNLISPTSATPVVPLTGEGIDPGDNPLASAEGPIFYDEFLAAISKAPEGEGAQSAASEAPEDSVVDGEVESTDLQGLPVDVASRLVGQAIFSTVPSSTSGGDQPESLVTESAGSQRLPLPSPGVIAPPPRTQTLAQEAVAVTAHPSSTVAESGPSGVAQGVALMPVMTPAVTSSADAMVALDSSPSDVAQPMASPLMPSRGGDISLSGEMLRSASQESMGTISTTDVVVAPSVNGQPLSARITSELVRPSDASLGSTTSVLPEWSTTLETPISDRSVVERSPALVEVIGPSTVDGADPTALVEDKPKVAVSAQSVEVDSSEAEPKGSPTLTTSPSVPLVVEQTSTELISTELKRATARSNRDLSVQDADGSEFDLNVIDPVTSSAQRVTGADFEARKTIAENTVDVDLSAESSAKDWRFDIRSAALSNADAASQPSQASGPSTGSTIGNAAVTDAAGPMGAAEKFVSTLLGISSSAQPLSAAERTISELKQTKTIVSAPHLARWDAAAVQVELVRMIKDGGGQVIMKLTPPDESSFRIDLSLDPDRGVRIIVEGASDSVRTRLEQGADQLREQFSQMGFNLQLDMNNRREAAAQSGGGFGMFEPGDPGDRGLSREDSPRDDLSLAATGATRRSRLDDSRINLRA